MSQFYVRILCLTQEHLCSAAPLSSSSQPGGGCSRAAVTGGTAVALLPARRWRGGGWPSGGTGQCGARRSPYRPPGAAGPAGGWSHASARPLHCSGMCAAGPCACTSPRRYVDKVPRGINLLIHENWKFRNSLTSQVTQNSLAFPGTWSQKNVSQGSSATRLQTCMAVPALTSVLVRRRRLRPSRFRRRGGGAPSGGRSWQTFTESSAPKLPGGAGSSARNFCACALRPWRCSQRGAPTGLAACASTCSPPSAFRGVLESEFELNLGLPYTLGC